VQISLHQQLSRRERRVPQRIEKKNWSGQSPMIAPPSIEFELSDRVQAVNAGGLGVIQQMVKQLGLPASIVLLIFVSRAAKCASVWRLQKDCRQCPFILHFLTSL